MTDLRKAIWESIKDWDINTPEYSGYCKANGSHVETVFNAVKALAQPVDTVNISQECVDETAKREHEPVAWLSPCFNADGDPLGYTAHEQEVYGSFPVYTAPPNPSTDWEAVAADQAMTIAMMKIEKREASHPEKQDNWVGLTDDDFNVKKVGDFDVTKFAKHIEQVLKEKNGYE